MVYWQAALRCYLVIKMTSSEDVVISIVMVIILIIINLTLFTERKLRVFDTEQKVNRRYLKKLRQRQSSKARRPFVVT